MCYSAESSLTSFVIGAAASIYLLIAGDKYDKHIGLFLITVVIIQLVEFFMWKDQSCGRMNHYASKSVNFVLLSQVYSIIIGFYIFRTSNIPQKTLQYALIPITIIYIYRALSIFLNDEGHLCSKPDERNALQWDRKEPPLISSIIYFGVFLIAPLLISHKWKGKLLLGILISTFLYSYIQWKQSVYSRWCYIAAGVPVGFVILSFLKK